MDDMLFKQYPYFNRKNIHIPNGDAYDMNAEASKYNDVLEQQGQRDIQILGIGENGHIDLMNLVRRLIALLISLI